MRRGQSGALSAAGVVQRGQDVLHPEAGTGELEVEQPGHLARVRVGQHVARREVAVDDLGGQAVGAGPPPPGAASRRIEQPRLLGAHPGGAQLAAQDVDRRVVRPDPARVGAPVPQGVCERHVRQRGAEQSDGPAEALERRLAVHAGVHAGQPPADGGGSGRGPDHRPSAGRGHGLGHLEGKATLPQPPQDPVLGADLRDGQEPADPQHVALLPVAYQESPVVGSLLAGGDDARARRQAPPGQQRGGVRSPHCGRSARC